MRAIVENYGISGHNKSISGDALLSSRLVSAAHILNEVVEINPQKGGGTPVLAGTRFKISQVLGELADGKSIFKLCREYKRDRKKLVNLLRGLAIHLDRPLDK